MFAYCRLLIACSVLCLAVNPVLAANTPVPSVDIVVRMKPDGRKIAKLRTDSVGFYRVDHLGPGKYEIAIDPPVLKKNSYVSSKSTLASVANPNGLQSITLDYELFAGKSKQEDFPKVEIEIVKNQGEVSGYITTEVSTEMKKPSKKKKKAVK